MKSQPPSSRLGQVKRGGLPVQTDVGALLRTWGGVGWEVGGAGWGEMQEVKECVEDDIDKGERKQSAAVCAGPGQRPVCIGVYSLCSAHFSKRVFTG